jgi:hypothetical protein
LNGLNNDAAQASDAHPESAVNVDIFDKLGGGQNGQAGGFAVIRTVTPAGLPKIKI